MTIIFFFEIAPKFSKILENFQSQARALAADERADAASKRREQEQLERRERNQQAAQQRREEVEISLDFRKKIIIVMCVW